MIRQALDQAKVVMRFEMYVYLSVAMIETGTTVVQRVSCPVIQLCTVCAEMFARRFFLRIFCSVWVIHGSNKHNALCTVCLCQCAHACVSLGQVHYPDQCFI